MKWIDYCLREEIQRDYSFQRGHLELKYLQRGWLKSAQLPTGQFSVEHLQFSTVGRAESIDFDLDGTLQQFLAVGGSRLEIYDSNQIGRGEEEQILQPIASSVRVPVSGDRSVCRLKHLRWFPIDNNLLSGATLDGRLMVYEGGSLVPVESFSLPKGVIINDQSLCQSSKMLAAATSHGLRLFDLRSGGHSIQRMAWDTLRPQDLFAGGEGGLFGHWDLRRLDRPVFVEEAKASSAGGGLDATNLHALPPSFGDLGTVFAARRDGSWAVYAHYWHKWILHSTSSLGALSGHTGLVASHLGMPILMGGGNSVGQFGVLDLLHGTMECTMIPRVLAVDKVIVGGSSSSKAFILDKTASMITLITRQN